jgi:hypothetical protein
MVMHYKIMTNFNDKSEENKTKQGIINPVLSCGVTEIDLMF